jgi:very-short-patch-repair endonuclease
MRTDTIYHVNYWLKRGFNESDAKIKVEISKKETSWRCKEFWIKKGYSENDALKEISRKQSEISFKRDRTKKRKCPYTEEYYIEKGINDLNEIKKLIQEYKNKTNPYLVCSKEKIQNIIEKRNITYYNKPKEVRDKINISRSFNKEQTIKKYGLEKSLEIFKNRRKGARKSYEKKFSKISMSLFDEIKNMNLDKDFLYGKKEKFIAMKCEGKRKGYYVDFYFEKENKIIEFNGDFWHFNPKKYLPESFIILGDSKFIAKDIWNNDKIKNDLFKQYGYDVLTIWEMDYRENKDEIIKLCNDFINNNYEKNNTE